MTIELRLDVPAVRNLIENDAEFSLELKRAVTGEIVRSVILKDAAKILELIEPAVYLEIVKAKKEMNWMRLKLEEALGSLLTRDSPWGTSFQVGAELKAKLDSAVAPVVAGYVKQVSDSAEVALRNAAVKAAEGVEAVVDKRVARLTEELINREVDIKFKARIAAIVAASE